MGKLYEIGKKISPKGILVAIKKCRECGHLTTGEDCNNCYLKKWEEARRDSIDEVRDGF